MNLTVKITNEAWDYITNSQGECRLTITSTLGGENIIVLKQRVFQDYTKPSFVNLKEPEGMTKPAEAYLIKYLGRKRLGGLMFDGERITLPIARQIVARKEWKRYTRRKTSEQW